MDYKVKYSDDAKRDIENIFSHIADVLIEPASARRLTDKLIEKANSLDFMPFRHQACETEPLKSRGIRFFPVDKYLIFYLPNENQKTVEIIRIMHGSADVEKHLPAEN